MKKLSTLLIESLVDNTINESTNKESKLLASIINNNTQKIKKVYVATMGFLEYVIREEDYKKYDDLLDYTITNLPKYLKEIEEEVEEDIEDGNKDWLYEVIENSISMFDFDKEDLIFEFTSAEELARVIEKEFRKVFK